jgi:rRNA maturation RNase YbeY
MRIELTELHAPLPIDESAVRTYAGWIMEKVCGLCPGRRWSELSIVLTDDSIRELNRTWFGRDTVTDVISFDYPDTLDGATGTGEIIINLEQALGEGRERESPDYEFALYLAHGCHHLTGAEDQTPEDKNAMLTLEQQWVEQAIAENHCGPFFLTP